MVSFVLGGYRMPAEQLYFCALLAFAKFNNSGKYIFLCLPEETTVFLLVFSINLLQTVQSKCCRLVVTKNGLL